MRLDEHELSVSIGDDCMFSAEICIYSTDGHAIYDINTNEILNRGKDVVIGNHCWVGRRAAFLKGAKISNNTVVGFGSIVNKQFNESNVVLAGTPASIVTRSVGWKRENPCHLKRG